MILIHDINFTLFHSVNIKSTIATKNSQSSPLKTNVADFPRTRGSILLTTNYFFPLSPLMCLLVKDFKLFTNLKMGGEKPTSGSLTSQNENCFSSTYVLTISHQYQ